MAKRRATPKKTTTKKRKRAAKPRAKPKKPPKRKAVKKPLKVEEGSFVLLNHTSRVKETNQTIETTLEEKAKEEGLYNAAVNYEPGLVVPGGGWLLKAVEEELLGMKEQSAKTIEVPPTKAFGPRDASKIKIVPLRKFRGSKVTPVMGARVEVNGKEGVVRSVGSGRVQVDFNPPLAGKTLLYDVRVEKIVTDRAEKIKALIHDRVPEVNIDTFKVKEKRTRLGIGVPSEAFLLPGLQLAKRVIVKRILDHFPGVKTVSFTEEYARAAQEEKS